MALENQIATIYFDTHWFSFNVEGEMLLKNIKFEQRLDITELYGKKPTYSEDSGLFNIINS